MIQVDTAVYEGTFVSGELVMTIFERDGRRAILVEVNDNEGRLLIEGGIRAARILANSTGNITGIEVPETRDGATISFVLKLKNGIGDKQAHDALCAFRTPFKRSLAELNRRRAEEWFTTPNA